jgi:S1-C subfamily serine protease
MLKKLLIVVALVGIAPNVLAREIANKTPSYLLENEKNTIEVFKNLSANVVNIKKTIMRTNIFSMKVTEIPKGSGSGIIWDKKGHIVTNYHVAKGQNSLYVKFNNIEKPALAKVIGWEPRKDIAVLKVDLPKGLEVKRLKLADTNEVLVGQKAIVIGSPFGLDLTLTVGTISALGRSIMGVGQVHINDMIQTDAAINPGNSGGPLLDSRGYLMGMNTVIYSGSGSSAGIGFAVPANTMRRMVNQIIKYGKVRQAGIGISKMDLNTGRFGVTGVMIRDVLRGGPAAKAGLRGMSVDRRGEVLLGDIIIKVDGSFVKDYDELYNKLEGMEIGTEVKITYIRNGDSKTTNVKLVDISSL